MLKMLKFSTNIYLTLRTKKQKLCFGCYGTDVSEVGVVGVNGTEGIFGGLGPWTMLLILSEREIPPGLFQPYSCDVVKHEERRKIKSFLEGKEKLHYNGE